MLFTGILLESTFSHFDGFHLKLNLFLRLTLLLSITFSLGCQLRPSEDPDASAFMLVKRDNEPVFLPMELMIEGFGPEESFKDQSKFFPKIADKFRRSGLFDVGESKKGHVIFVQWESWKRDRSLPEIGSQSVRSKWSMVESDAEMFHRMEVRVIENGAILKRYEYTQIIDYRGRGFLDNANRYLSWFHHGVNPMLSRFFLDLKKDGYLLI